MPPTNEADAAQLAASLADATRMMAAGILNSPLRRASVIHGELKVEIPIVCRDRVSGRFTKVPKNLAKELVPKRPARQLELFGIIN